MSAEYYYNVLRDGYHMESQKDVTSYLEQEQLDENEIMKVLAYAITYDNYNRSKVVEYLTKYITNKYSYSISKENVENGSEADKILAQSLCQSCVMLSHSYDTKTKSLIEYVLKHIKSADKLSITYTEWQKQKADKEIADIIKARLDWLIVMKHINNKDNIKTFCENITKIDINCSYSNGETALMRASKLGLYEVVLALISAGADINAKDTSYKNVLNYAAEGGNTKIMELLLSRGAK